MYLFRLLFVVFCVLFSSRLMASQIRVVGSSTVFPFISSIAEEFGRFSAYRTPVIESVGSGMGFNMFCAGSGQGTPDIAMSSRRISDAEVDLCKINGVHDAIEIELGYDGIVVASSTQKDIVDFSLRDLFSALSKYSLFSKSGETPSLNKYSEWHEIRSALPEREIEIYGPHKNTGTYDALVHSVMLGTCMSSKNFIDSYPDIEERKSMCGMMRNDGRYIEVATSENVVIQKVSKNSSAFGILSFSFLVKNQREIHGNKIAGIEPSYATISSGDYPLARSIYIYVKQEHLNTTPGLKDFIKEILGPVSTGGDGYLVNLGFIPLPEERLTQTREKVEKLMLDSAGS